MSTQHEATRVAHRPDDDLDRLAHAVLFPGFVGTDGLPPWLTARLARGLGGVVLFGRNVTSSTQVRALTDALREHRPEVLVAIDEEGGDVTRLHAATGSPYLGALALGQVDDAELTRATAAAIAAELSRAGIDWNLAPIADVNSNAANPVIGVRAFGAEAGLVSRHVAAYVEGTQQSGIVACAKHFPGHGDTSVDSHLGLPTVTASEQELERVHLAPFRAAVAAGARSVMTGHLLVPAWDRALAATVSPTVLTGVLRSRLGFEGVVMSDALEMAGIAATVGIERGAVLALLAGCDALCLGGELADDDVVARTHGAIVAAVGAGELSRERLAGAARRVARLAAWRAQHRVAPDAPLPVPPPGAGVTSSGDVRIADGRLQVITLDPVPTMAVGAVPWGVAELLLAARPGSVAQVWSGPDAAGRPPGDGPLVVVTRDPHRHPWQRAALRDVLSARPGVVVVDMGLPVELPELAAAAGVVRTRGASTTSARAAVALLLGGADR